MRWDYEYLNNNVHSSYLSKGRHVVMKNMSDNYLDGVYLNSNASIDSFSVNYPMHILGVNTAGTNTLPFVGSTYDVHIWDNGIPVRNLVPCVRIADSKPGLYDLCGSICSITGTPFYVNSGTGEDFTWGELE